MRGHLLGPLCPRRRAAARAGWDGVLLVKLFCKPGVGALREGSAHPQAEPGQQVGMLVFHLTAKSNPKTAGD